MGQPIDRVRVSSYSREPSNTERGYYGEFIAALAARRVFLGHTQEQLDEILGVSDGQVAKWEAFQRLPGAFMMVCWATALGVSLSVVHHPAP